MKVLIPIVIGLLVVGDVCYAATKNYGFDFYSNGHFFGLKRISNF